MPMPLANPPEPHTEPSLSLPPSETLAQPGNAPLQKVARQVVEQLTRLLQTGVIVTDQAGWIIASDEPAWLGLSLQRVRSQFHPLNAAIPLRWGEDQGTIRIAASTQTEPLNLRLIQRLVDLILQQTTVLTSGTSQHELKHKFIHDLLRGRPLNHLDILRDGQIFGMDLTRPRAVVLIDAANYILATSEFDLERPTHQIWWRAQRVISSVVSFFHLPNDTICAYIGDGEIAVLKASRTQDLAAWASGQDQSSLLNSSWANLSALKRAGNALLSRLRSDTQGAITIGIGRYHPQLEGLAHSYQDARAALGLGKHFHGQNQVHCLDSLGIAAFIGLADEATKIDLARHLLSPLDRETELLETLNVFFDQNCCPSTTAQQLSIHRNTLSYRLEKVTLLTGLDPRRFDQAMQIRLALLLRSLPTSPSPPPDQHPTLGSSAG